MSAPSPFKTFVQGAASDRALTQRVETGNSLQLRNPSQPIAVADIRLRAMRGLGSPMYGGEIWAFTVGCLDYLLPVCEHRVDFKISVSPWFRRGLQSTFVCKKSNTKRLKIEAI